MSIKGFKRMQLHNMGHFRVRRVRVDYSEGANIKKINPLLSELERAIAAEQKVLAPPVNLEGTEK